MPLKEGVLLSCKSGVVELAAELVDAATEDPGSFVERVRSRIFEHQYQLMTDAAILDPDDLAATSAIVSRDPLAPPLRDALISLGFEPTDSGSGPYEEASLLSRFQKPRRSRLDKWRLPYLRSTDLDPRLAEIEASLIEEMPAGPLAEVHEDGTRALIDAARTYWKLLLAPGLEGLGELERRLLQAFAAKRGRVVLHPAAVRALACYTGESIRRVAPDTRWSDDPEETSPLFVEAEGGTIVRSDPELRVVQFVAHARKALLSAYAESVVQQSLTDGAN